MNRFSKIESRSPRVGLFGGTFNPIHRGHIQVAKDVLQQYHLAQIYFMPSALPPHKFRGELAAAADRFEMARMALAGESAFTVSDVEIRRPGPSYTVDTLHHFKSMKSGELQLFFIVGLDAFLEIHTWKSYCEMFELATFIVMARPLNRSLGIRWPESVVAYARQWLSKDYTLSAPGDALIHPQKEPIYLAQVTPIPISSSHIREMIGQGRSIREWVAPSVADYIENRGLYR